MKRKPQKQPEIPEARPIRAPDGTILGWDNTARDNAIMASIIGAMDNRTPPKPEKI